MIAAIFWDVLRVGQGLAAEFPGESTEVSAVLSYPGTIKAFHFHRQQMDCWVPVQGMFQVALADPREQYPSFSARNTLYVWSIAAVAAFDSTGSSARLQSD
jgi:dTDP-4-dehydrorhamnose 3,5-epimerase